MRCLLLLRIFFLKKSVMKCLRSKKRKKALNITTSIGPEPVLAAHAPFPPAAGSHCPAREGSAPHWGTEFFFSSISRAESAIFSLSLFSPAAGVTATGFQSLFSLSPSSLTVSHTVSYRRNSSAETSFSPYSRRTLTSARWAD